MTEYLVNSFKPHELRCHCHYCRDMVEHQLRRDALDALQRVRDKFHAQTGRGVILSSAYRCARHPEEVKKRKKYGEDYRGGKHYQGTAFDIRVPWGRDRMLLIALLIEEGFDAFGFADSFIHADYKRGHYTSWSYN